MAYGQAVEQRMESPEERLKRITLEQLSAALADDASNQRRPFCIRMKNYLRLMKAFMPDEIVDTIEKKYDELQVEIAKIKIDETKTKPDIEAAVVAKEYAFYDDVMKYGIDALQNSRMIQKEMDGVLLTGDTVKELLDRGEAIQKSKAVQEVASDEEKGVEWVADAGEDQVQEGPK